MANLFEAANILAADDSSLNDLMDIIPMVVPGVAGNDKGRGMTRAEFVKRMRNMLINRKAAILREPYHVQGFNETPATRIYTGGVSDGTTIWYVETDIDPTPDVSYGRALTAATLIRDPDKDIILGAGSYRGVDYDGTYLRFMDTTPVTGGLKAFRASDQARVSDQDIPLEGSTNQLFGLTYYDGIHYVTTTSGTIQRYDNATRSRASGADLRPSPFDPRGGIAVTEGQGNFLIYRQSGNNIPLFSFIQLPGGGAIPNFVLSALQSTEVLALGGFVPNYIFTIGDRIYTINLSGQMFAYRMNWDASSSTMYLTTEPNGYVDFRRVDLVSPLSLPFAPRRPNPQILLQPTWSTELYNTDYLLRLKSENEIIATLLRVSSSEAIQPISGSTTTVRAEPVTSRFLHEPGDMSEQNYSLDFHPLGQITSTRRHYEVLSAGSFLLAEEL